MQTSKRSGNSNASHNNRDELKLKLHQKLQSMNETQKKKQQTDAKMTRNMDLSESSVQNAKSDIDFTYTSFNGGDVAAKPFLSMPAQNKKGEKHKQIEKRIRLEERK